jgi:phosphomannomutase
MRYGLGLLNWAQGSDANCVLDDSGWPLIRFSGTQPIIRVYCETTDESKVQPLLDAGLELAGLA